MGRKNKQLERISFKRFSVESFTNSYKVIASRKQNQIYSVSVCETKENLIKTG